MNSERGINTNFLNYKFDKLRFTKHTNYLDQQYLRTQQFGYNTNKLKLTKRLLSSFLISKENKDRQAFRQIDKLVKIGNRKGPFNWNHNRTQIKSWVDLDKIKSTQKMQQKLEQNWDNLIFSQRLVNKKSVVPSASQLKRQYENSQKYKNRIRKHQFLSKNKVVQLGGRQYKQYFNQTYQKPSSLKYTQTSQRQKLLEYKMLEGQVGVKTERINNRVQNIRFFKKDNYSTTDNLDLKPLQMKTFTHKFKTKRHKSVQPLKRKKSKKHKQKKIKKIKTVSKKLKTKKIKKVNKKQPRIVKLDNINVDDNIKVVSGLAWDT